MQIRPFLRHIVLFISAFFVCHISFAQVDTIWLNGQWQKTEKKNAAFFRQSEKKDGRYYLKDYYLSGVLQMSGSFTSLDPYTEDGYFAYYFADGTKESDGSYSAGKRTGTWIYYYSSGNIKSRKNYEDDFLMGPAEFYDSSSGKLSLKGQFIHNDHSGKWISYNTKTGKPKELKFFDTDSTLTVAALDAYGEWLSFGNSVWDYSTAEWKAVGDWIYYYSDSNHRATSNIRSRRKFVRSRFDGVQTDYYRNGVVARIFLENMDRCTKITYFDDDSVEHKILVEKYLPDTTYYDSGDNITGRNGAAYYSILGDSQNVFTYKELYAKDNKLKRTGFYVLNETFEKEVSLFAKVDSQLGHYLTKKGKWNIFYPETGTLYMTEKYSKGDVDGTLLTYYPDGKIKSQEQYSYGNIDEGKSFLPTGEEMPFIPYYQSPKAPDDIAAYMKKNTHSVAAGHKNTVKVSFVIMEDGSITDVKTAGNNTPTITKQAIKIITNMPKWKPAMIDGKPVKHRRILPVDFS